MELKTISTSLGNVSYRSLGQGQRKAFFFHGFPASSSQLRIFEHFVDEIGLEIICFDRPGYNLTRITTEDMLQTTMAITSEIAEQKNWKKYEVVSVSGGTPYALQAAMQFPMQVTEVRVMCGLGYLRHPEVKKTFPRASYMGLQVLPFISKDIIRTILKLTVGTKKPKRHSRTLQYFFPSSPADNRNLLRPGAADQLRLKLQEAMVQNGLGPKQDAKAYLSKWGQNLEHLQQPVTFWHGEEDTVVPHHISAAMHKLIKHSKYHLLPNEGHVSLPNLRAEEIMRYQR